MLNTRLFKLLPPQWKRDPLARRIAWAVGRPLDEIKLTIELLYRHIDPQGAPPESLDWLMSVVALPARDDLSILRKRNLIRAAWHTWSQKGTLPAIEQWVRAVTGVRSEVRTLNMHAFIAGISKAGDHCGPGELAWRWEVAIPAGSIDPVLLRELLEPMVCSAGTYRIVDLDHNLLSDFPS